MPTPNNLPAELTSFVGRERELAELRRLLRKSRLVTLTGPGGAGKTRLARRLVVGLLDRFPGGAWFVELGPVNAPELVDRTVAAACEVREEKDRPIVELLLMRLAGPRTLLILDGAEHLVDACTELAQRLLKGSQNLTLLVTSREPLGVSGELVWRTPSLTVPGPDDAERPGLLLKSEAVRLFIDRAKLSRPDFILEPPAYLQLADVCIRLEALPLAIELAATLVNVMTVQEIRARLSDRYRLLTGGSRTAVGRYRTLRHAIDWSYDLLSTDEKELFSRLAVFAGGFDLDAAEAVGSSEDEDVFPTLMRLVNKSLVVAESKGSTTRYRMLDTIREYASDKLRPPNSIEARRRHAGHFLDFSRQAAKELRTGDQAAWLERTEDEMPNLRLALLWQETESPDNLMMMTGSLSRYWYVRGKFSEGLDWMDKALAASAEDAAARLPALQARARLRRHRGDYDGARRDAQECADLARRVGADQQLMGALITLGNLSASMADWDDAERSFTEALHLQERLGDPAIVATGLNNLALIESARGDHQQAGDLVERALQAVTGGGDRILEASIRETAGRIERRLGNHATARQHYFEALAISAEFEDILNIADVLDGLALLAVADRNPTRALVLAGASSRQRLASQSEPSRWDQNEVHQGVAKARSMLATTAASEAWRRGVTFSLEEAVAFAKGSATEKRAHGGSALTAREMQVASLIGEGLTNGEIAGRLKVAERTADAHVEHIRNKLGLHTRSQIAVWAYDARMKA